MPTKGTPARADWAQILVDAVSKPGVISKAYSTFWNYSVGNQLLAMFQCMQRRIEPGPIKTFAGWKELGRTVKKGQRAITLCMPVAVRQKKAAEQQTAEDEADTVASLVASSTRRVFVYRPLWFVLSQTEGKSCVPTELPQWQESRALEILGIERIAFDLVNGNVQGYAKAMQIAVSPVAELPHKTLFHEMAHVLLGHTAEFGEQVDDTVTPREIREVEAEAVALICCESLNLSGVSECRGYIQHWLGREELTNRCAHRIFKAADMILRSGRPSVEHNQKV